MPSGVTTEQKLLSAENEINPDFYVDSINDFFSSGAPPSSADASFGRQQATISKP